MKLTKRHLRRIIKEEMGRKTTRSLASILFEDAEKAGIDLMLSGHTHKGQVFPFNLVVKKVFRYVSGLHRLGDSFLYVSQGTGTWGPDMRVGSFSEITLFEVKNEPKAP